MYDLGYTQIGLLICIVTLDVGKTCIYKIVLQNKYIFWSEGIY